LGQRPLTGVANGNDIDLLPDLVHLIDDDIVSGDKSPQIRIDVLRKTTAQ
jgi:hypothetical protein